MQVGWMRVNIPWLFLPLFVEVERKRPPGENPNLPEGEGGCGEHVEDWEFGRCIGINV
jgi:hypothetical protein